MKILIGRDTKVIRTRFGGDYKKYIEAGMMAEWGTPVVDWSTNGNVLAEVIRGKWTARCNHCSGAAFVDPAYPFFCPTCGMSGNGYKASKVVWPDDKTRAKIEWILLQRPDPKTRNWLPRDGETVQSLIIENQEHGHGFELPEALR